MPPSDAAVVTIVLDHARLEALGAISGVEMVDRPEWVSYPDVVRVAVRADTATQAALRAAGFDFDVAITAGDYQAQIDDVFATARDEPARPNEPA
jgi:hypothetical protein